MCDGVWPIERFRDRVAPEWIGHDAQVAHPSAPLGGGGPGYFRRAGPMNHDAHDELLPHTESPAAPLLTPGDLAPAIELQNASVKAQPAPVVTQASTTTVGRLDIVVDVDGSGGTRPVGAVTTPVLSHSGSVRKAISPDGKTIVRAINEKKFKVVIQTIYHQGKPGDGSKYGRGKAPADQAMGNVTLGFHESCHRADLVNFFSNVAQPELKVRENMPVADFDLAFKAYMAAWKALEAAAEADSELKTDEVDPKKSNYVP